MLSIGRAHADPIVLADGEGLQGRFEQSRHLRGFDKPIRSTGQFFLLPKSSLIWQTERPFFTRMVIDNKGISQSVEGAEVTRLDFDKFPGLQVMRSTLENSLSGNWAPLEKLTGSKLQPTGDKWSLRFTPKSSGLTLPFAYLSFEMSDYLEKVEIVKANGDKDVITFSQQKQAPVKEILEAAQKSRERQP
ncbi:outer membrane lipoprotein carrier protein LolA [Sneathiella sp.]|uniref:outer membrane lipoprotein carrier protein LolA n=1 Tax=Sneathiella sp. TaxID=1964365 RepID=UPI003569322A